MFINNRTMFSFLVLSIVLFTHFPGTHQQTTQSSTTASPEVTTQEKITDAPTTTPMPEGVLYQTELGEIRGREETFNGVKILMFRGIRYAKNPVGERRFLYPEPYNVWDSDATVNALNFGPRCVQPMKPDIQMSEDCLHLNVYTRNVSPTGSSPVVVLFNSGGWLSESAEMMHTKARSLAAEHLVVVTLNHRLGPLGFLSTEDDSATGSYGMMDQVEALRWVQNNIHQFGGNRDSVTLYGEKNGGHAVTLHMTSLQSRDLFHYAIAVDGVAPYSGMVWNNPSAQNLELAQELANNTGCPTDNNEEMIKCLRKVDWRTLNANAPQRDWPKPTWRVRVDGQFLKEGPDKAWSEGRFARVPFVAMSTLLEASGAGLTQEEFKSKVLKELLKGAYGDATDAMYNAIEFEYNGDSYRNVSNVDREKYFIEIKNDMELASVVKTLRTAAKAIDEHPTNNSASLHWAVGDIKETDQLRTVQTLARTGDVDQFNPFPWPAFTTDEKRYRYLSGGLGSPSDTYKAKQMAFWETHRQNVVNSITDWQCEVIPGECGEPDTTTVPSTTTEPPTTAETENTVSYDYFIATWVLLAVLLLVLIILIIVICHKTSEKSYNFD